MKCKLAKGLTYKKERKKKMWKGKKKNHQRARDVRIIFKLPGVNTKRKSIGDFCLSLVGYKSHGASPYWITFT